MHGRAVTPEQKRVIVERLYHAWCKQPAMRLGQFISNAIDPVDDYFYLEDEEFVQFLEEFK